MPRALKIWLALGAILLVGVVGWGISYALHPTRTFHSSGPSMEPALFDGEAFDVLLFSDDAPTHGDIVVVRSPVDEVRIAKRVVAVGGETVSISPECVVEVDGTALRHEPVECPRGPYVGSPFGDPEPPRCFREHAVSGATYIVLDTGNSCRSMGAIEVPEGHVFVLGDHRDRSNDSSNPHIGAIPLDRVVGVVELD